MSVKKCFSRVVVESSCKISKLWVELVLRGNKKCYTNLDSDRPALSVVVARKWESRIYIYILWVWWNCVTPYFGDTRSSKTGCPWRTYLALTFFYYSVLSDAIAARVIMKNAHRHSIEYSSICVIGFVLNGSSVGWQLWVACCEFPAELSCQLLSAVVISRYRPTVLAVCLRAINSACQ